MLRDNGNPAQESKNDFGQIDLYNDNLYAQLCKIEKAPDFYNNRESYKIFLQEIIAQAKQQESLSLVFLSQDNINKSKKLLDRLQAEETQKLAEQNELQKLSLQLNKTPLDVSSIPPQMNLITKSQAQQALSNMSSDHPSSFFGSFDRWANSNKVPIEPPKNGGEIKMSYVKN